MRSIDKCGVCRKDLSQLDATCDVYDLTMVTSVTRVHKDCFVCHKCEVWLTNENAIFQEDRQLLLCISDYLAEALPLNEDHAHPGSNVVDSEEQIAEAVEAILSSCQSTQESPLDKDMTSLVQSQAGTQVADSTNQTFSSDQAMVEAFDQGQAATQNAEDKPERDELDEIVKYLLEGQEGNKDPKPIKDPVGKEDTTYPPNSNQVNPTWKSYPMQWNEPVTRLHQPMAYHNGGPKFQHAYTIDGRLDGHYSEPSYFYHNSRPNPPPLPMQQRPAHHPPDVYYQQAYAPGYRFVQGQPDFKNNFKYERPVVNPHERIVRSASSSPDLDGESSSSRSRSAVERPTRRKSTSGSSESSSQSDNPPPKRFGHRSVINEQIKSILVETFCNNRYPNRIMRQQLAMATNLSPRQVQIWFQNQRSLGRRRGLQAQDRQWPMLDWDQGSSRIFNSSCMDQYASGIMNPSDKDQFTSRIVDPMGKDHIKSRIMDGPTEDRYNASSGIVNTSDKDHFKSKTLHSLVVDQFTSGIINSSGKDQYKPGITTSLSMDQYNNTSLIVNPLDKDQYTSRLEYQPY